MLSASQVKLESRPLRRLPRALGYEVGSTFKPVPNLVVNAALWSPHLEQELVYIGDVKHLLCRFVARRGNAGGMRELSQHTKSPSPYRRVAFQWPR